jgi:hypothetical protein
MQILSRIVCLINLKDSSEIVWHKGTGHIFGTCESINVGLDKQFSDPILIPFYKKFNVYAQLSKQEKRLGTLTENRATIAFQFNLEHISLSSFAYFFFILKCITWYIQEFQTLCP